jgi:hypothetical protein
VKNRWDRQMRQGNISRLVVFLEGASVSPGFFPISSGPNPEADDSGRVLAQTTNPPAAEKPEDFGECRRTGVNPFRKAAELLRSIAGPATDDVRASTENVRIANRSEGCRLAAANFCGIHAEARPLQLS